MKLFFKADGSLGLISKGGKLPHPEDKTEWPLDHAYDVADNFNPVISVDSETGDKVYMNRTQYLATL